MISKECWPPVLPYATLKKLHARLAEHEANQRAV
jgi:hypothetical protein